MGWLNELINNSKREWHLPGGYEYCGIGTKVEERVKRGDKGINPLDSSCKKHDLVYWKNKDLNTRHAADKVLAEEAWKRVLSKDAGFGEKATAWAVTNAMKAKVKLGMSYKKKKRRTKKKKKSCKGKKPTFQSVARKARAAIMKAKPKNIDSAIKVAVKTFKKSPKVKVPRVLPLVKGGVLPLIPIFSGLAALGALAGGASQIARTVKEAQDAKAQLQEATRHNRQMEAIAIGKGLFLKTHKKGYGLYLKKSKN